MKVITITREFGAGGGELGRRVAELLGWDVLDRELLHEAAKLEHVPDADLERLDEKSVDVADRFKLQPPHQKYIHGLTEAVRQAADRGNVILVGRGARHLLGDTLKAFHLRLVAPKPWRAQRMAKREGLSEEAALARCTEVDRTRDRFTRYFFGAAANQPAQYDLTINSSRIALEDVARVVADVVRGGDAPESEKPAAARRVLTLSRELGAGERGFAPTLADWLGLRVFDRELLEHEAVRLGVTEAELEKIDEQPAGIFQRFRPGSLYQRYFQALEQLIRELAQRGGVLLVGRGGSHFLRDDSRALHVHLVATMAERLRRVMEYHWLREGPARKLISQSDAQRQSFYESYFGADWSSPLEYHLTVNTGRLGPLAVELVAKAAERFWGRAP